MIRTTKSEAGKRIVSLPARIMGEIVRHRHDLRAAEDPKDNDYLVRVSIDHTTMLVLGVLSTVVFVVAARFLYTHRSATPNSRDAQLVALLMLAGLLLAGGLRMVTAA